MGGYYGGDRGTGGVRTPTFWEVGLLHVLIFLILRAEFALEQVNRAMKVTVVI